MELIMILVSLSSLVIMIFYLGMTFDARTKKMLDELRNEGELIKELEQEMNKLSSISATMYGQIVEREESHVDTDAEQTTDNKQ